MFGWDSFLYDLIGPFDFLIRLLGACVCGALVGYERTMRALCGVHLKASVALGSALLMMISKYAFFDANPLAGVDADMSRIASNVVTGVSFLGAGVIFVRGATIKGLTTAAGIWAVAAVGLAIGAGLYTLGVFSALLLIAIQILLHKFVPSHSGVFGDLTAHITKEQEDVLRHIKEDLASLCVTILSIEMKQLSDQSREFRFEMRLPTDDITEDLLALTEKYTQITSISI